MKFGRNLPLAKLGSKRVQGAKVHRADLESGSSRMGLVFITIRDSFSCRQGQKRARHYEDCNSSNKVCACKSAQSDEIATANLYHVTKSPLYLSFTVHYFFT